MVNTASTSGTSFSTASLPLHQDQHLDHREPEVPGRGHGTLVCLALMLSMPEGSWLRLGLWLRCGLGKKPLPSIKV